MWQKLSFTGEVIEVANTTIKNRIKVLRVMNDSLTQVQLAEKVGVTRQTILAIEAGKYLPSLEVAFKISKVFGTSIEDVFEFENNA